VEDWAVAFKVEDIEDDFVVEGNIIADDELEARWARGVNLALVAHLVRASNALLSTSWPVVCRILYSRPTEGWPNLRCSHHSSSSVR
jgi:hypothetical protein